MAVEFRPQHIDPILNKEKCITVRLAKAFNLYFKEGDQVVFTRGGEPFAQVTIDKISEMSVNDFVDARLAGHETYSTTAQLIEQLDEYYPEERCIHSNSKLYVIWFRHVKPLTSNY